MESSSSAVRDLKEDWNKRKMKLASFKSASSSFTASADMSGSPLTGTSVSRGSPIQHASSRPSPLAGGGVKPGRARRLRTGSIRLDRKHVLGAGSAGRVYLGLNEDNGELVAIKEVVFENVGELLRQQLRGIQREIRLMEQLQHPNIVKYYGVDWVNKSLLIYMEYAPGGSLAGLVKRFGPLTELTVAKFLRQALCGLQYLHMASVAHRDIKGDNILLSASGEVKLADFGTAKRLGASHSIDNPASPIGTPWFMAPEILKYNLYDLPGDIWAIGATTIELLTGRPPFADCTNARAAMFRILSSSSPPPFPPNASDICKSFLSRCLCIEPGERASVKELQVHPFLNEDECSSLASSRSSMIPLAGLGSSSSSFVSPISHRQHSISTANGHIPIPVLAPMLKPLPRATAT
eukprot:RCo038468